MPGPSNYDDISLTIQVDPLSLYHYATVEMPAQANILADALGEIVKIWNDLKVGWVGTTASEAEDFNKEWIRAVQQLFGTKAHPKTGALPKIADAVDLASINYGEAEDTVQKMFNQLSDQLAVTAMQGAMQGLPGASSAGPIGDGPARTPQSGPDPNPISESAPAPPAAAPPTPSAGPVS